MQGRTIPGVVVQVAAKTAFAVGGVAAGSAACSAVATSVVCAVGCRALVGDTPGGLTDSAVPRFWP